MQGSDWPFCANLLACGLGMIQISYAGDHDICEHGQFLLPSLCVSDFLILLHWLGLQYGVGVGGAFSCSDLGEREC